MEKHNIKANENQMEILWDVIDINKKDKVTFEEVNLFNSSLWMSSIQKLI